ncbi:hypothetical protein Clacol_009304 [Clathrus columnatus]|uniref:Uncharacterized protein n=1 Tax=Clathrus columnatus TaxID=1419009 RepID=A0AAV5AKT7_9AGAM|nr:hypothetical protein Clacol_009304 [Clathrus columnatus]
MVVSTFSVFIDTAIPQQTPATSIPFKPSRKAQHIQPSDATTKENVNPLTGELFESQPPLKKRKPSSTSVLKTKVIASSSKSSSKHRKPSAGKERKERGKKSTTLGSNVIHQYEFDTSVAPITALGNRKAYEFTVTPLADVTQAYDESEALRSLNAVARNLESEMKVESSVIPDQLINKIETPSSEEVIEPQSTIIDATEA